jgi:hypothetical protein
MSQLIFLNLHLLWNGIKGKDMNLKTTEGTELKHLLHKEPGTIGAFIQTYENMKKFERLAQSYCARNGAIINCKSYPLAVKDKVTYAVFVLVVKKARPRMKRGRK